MMTTQKWFYVFFTILVLLTISSLTLAVLFHYTNKNLKQNYRAYLHSITPEYLCIGVGCYGRECKEKYSLCLIPESEEEARNDSSFTPQIQYEKKRMAYVELQNMAKEVISRLPDIHSHSDIVKLVVETAITESDGGYFIDTKGMGGLGVTQFNYQTAKYLLSHFEKYDPTVLSYLNQFRDKSLSLRENLTYNLHFNMAMCILYYYHRKNEVHLNVKSMQDRAKLWKEVYNTSLGKGTPQLYIKRVKSYTEQ